MEQPHYAILATKSVAVTKYSSRFLEIAIIKRTSERVLETFTSLLNPRCILPEESIEMVGISQEMIRFQPVFCEVAEQILQILENAIIVSLDAKVDYRILRSEFKTIGYEFSSKIQPLNELINIGTSELPLLNSQINQSNHETLTKNTTSAKENAKASARLFLQALNSNFYKNGKFVLKTNTPRPVCADSLLIDSLERKPGVYYFKDDQNNILYIGKAVKLRDRVRSHFNSRSEREQILCSKTFKIDYIYTGSNMIAELLESDEIQSKQPPSNIAQKDATTPFIIVSSTNSKGYLKLSIVRKDYTDSVNEVFYNRNSCIEKLREVCDLFKLCPKLCGFQRVRGSCMTEFQRACPKACVGKEEVGAYNARACLAQDFLTNNLKNFAIKLKGKRNDEWGFVLVRNGVYIGYGYVDINEQIKSVEELDTFVERRLHSYHTTRIIDSYIRKPKNKKNIFSFQ